MQLSATTDYGIRIVLYLIKNNEIISSGVLAEQLQIPKTYVLKVTKKLELANIVTSYQGVNGGIGLAGDPAQITLWDVISAVESTTVINKCMEQENEYDVKAEDYCKLRKVYGLLQQAVEDRLQSIKLIDLT